MPTLTIRLSDDEKRNLEAAYAEWASPGQTVSDYVRETLSLREQRERLDGLESFAIAANKRLARLEEVAGL